MYGISRIEQRGYHSWYARIYRDGKIIPASFSDNKHGGKRKALKAAKVWRDKQLIGMPLSNVRTGPRPSLEHKRCCTGVAGVQMEIRRENGAISAIIWTAIWRIKNPTTKGPGTIRRTRSFSVVKYGYRGAFLWAAYIRASKLGVELDLQKLNTPPYDRRYHKWMESRECFKRRVRYKDYSGEDNTATSRCGTTES
jgi:hypothetical protein